ncbi:hypothetical protein [Reichenbachiella agariperforans]|nr:hypothetical protein [Reichenbachiella agariperforans]MBU2913539.1 hypothetical protein [Reichenbachiella agariperforans]
MATVNTYLYFNGNCEDEHIMHDHFSGTFPESVVKSSERSNLLETLFRM